MTTSIYIMYTCALEAWPHLKLNHFDIYFYNMEEVDIKKIQFFCFHFFFYQCSFCFDILQFLFFLNYKGNRRVQMKSLTYISSLMSKDYKGLTNTPRQGKVKGK
jgi:hypothetical protein